jgi:hypothetical protein
MAEGDSSWLAPLMDWVVDVDVPATKAAVADLRARNPNLSNDDLAGQIFSKARWKGAATGVLTGLPANPWVSVPAAAADMAAMMRLEVSAAAHVALLYDPDFFEDEASALELLVPVLGMNATSQAMRELGVRGAMGVTRQTIRSVLTKQTLRTFQRIMLKYFGIKVTQRALITKTLPIVGGIVGGGWNWVEMTAVGTRCVAYFEGRPLED